MISATKVTIIFQSAKFLCNYFTIYIADDLAYKFFCVKPRRGVKITGKLRKPEGLIRIQTGVECVAERSTEPLLGMSTIY